MVDIHSHILPGVDDGSPDVETSLKMLQQAKNAGTQAVVLTPHVNRFGDGRNLAGEIIDIFEDFKQKTIEENIGVDVFFGGEVFCTGNVLDFAAQGLLPTINHSRYMLVEFNFQEKMNYMMHTLMVLNEMGYVPIVAHPERYDCIKENSLDVLNLMNAGALIQVNKGSLAGDFGAKCKDVAWDLVYRRMAHFVATDSHNLDGRNTEMDFVFDAVRKEITENYAMSLFDINQTAVLNNGMIMVPRPRV